MSSAAIVLFQCRQRKGTKERSRRISSNGRTLAYGPYDDP